MLLNRASVGDVDWSAHLHDNQLSWRRHRRLTWQCWVGVTICPNTVR